MAEVNTGSDTKTISIRGMGNVIVPKNWSNDQILEAVRAHPDYEKAMAEPEPKSGLRKAAENVAGFTNEVPKGIPLAGHLVPQSQFNKTFVREHPNWALGARLTGAVGSSYPAMRFAGGVAGGSILGETAANAAIGGATGTGDELVRQHVAKEPWDTGKALNQGLWSAGLAAPGPALGHIITPSVARGVSPGDASNIAASGAARMNSMGTRAVGGEDLVNEVSKGVGRTPTHSPPPNWSADLLSHTGAALGAAGGAGIAHAAGLPHDVGAIVGGFAGLNAPQIRDALMRSPWSTNKVLDTPAKRDIINALLASTGTAVKPKKETENVDEELVKLELLK